MFIRLVKIDEHGSISIYSHNNQEVWYLPGDTIDPGDNTHFEINYTCYGDYSGCTVTRSNHRCLIKILEDENIEHVVYPWAYWTYTIYIPLRYLGNEVLDEIIKGLDGYPCIDDEDLSALEWELTEEYFADSWLRGELKLQDPEGKSEAQIIDDYLEAHSYLDEGMIFETNCVAYLGKENIEAMREYLINELGYQPEDD
jgi:hypothetical protein